MTGNHADNNSCWSFCLFQPSQIPLDENLLVSRYINDPLLIDGEYVKKRKLVKKKQAIFYCVMRFCIRFCRF